MLGHGRRRKYIVKDDHTGIHFRINNYGSTEIFDTEKPYFSQMSHTDYRYLNLVRKAPS